MDTKLLAFRHVQKGRQAVNLTGLIWAIENSI